MIREEKQRQLDALTDELADNDAAREELMRHAAVVQAWLDGYDTANAVAIEPDPAEMPFPLPTADKTIGSSEFVEHQVLEVLSTGRQLSLEQLRRSFGWSHFETDNAVAHLFATQKISLGLQGYRLKAPGDESFARPADESPSRSNGGGLA